MDKLKQDVIQCIRFSLTKDNQNIFESIMDRVKLHYEKPCNDIASFSRRTTKNKGDVFEIFCQMYLISLDFYDHVWLLHETPKDIKDKLGLKNQDVGIDIVCQRKDKFYAVQVKYRKKPKHKLVNVLTWKQLSTFYALCARTGPFEKQIVMTNCDYVRHQGKGKNDSDYTIAYKRFANTKRKQWEKMIGFEGNKLDDNKNISKDKMREQRLKYFQAISDTSTN